MLRSVIAIFLAFGIAVASGAGSVYLALDQSHRFGTIDIGPWTAYPELGTPEADPYSRARFAREGTLALGSAEGLVLTARSDSAGAMLSPSCVYRLVGDMPPARFWTLHTIDAEGRAHRPDGPAARTAALHSQALLRSEDGDAVITAALAIQPGNWLRTPDIPGFGLVVTLYDTSIAGSARISEVSMPEIVRVSCNG
jgi:hypothetical protein